MRERDGEHEEMDASPGVAPDEPAFGPALTIEVDGEVFEVRPDGRRGTSYDWTSGPNEGYGFGLSPSDGYSLDDHRQSIRDFLEMIDPATGYIGD